MADRELRGARRRRRLTGTGGLISSARAKVRARRCGAALAVALVLLATAAGAATAGSCAPKQFGGSGFVVCAFDPAHDDIRLFWRGPDRKPYARFAALAAALKAKRRDLLFAMNGGMFEEDLTPVGLYVEDGRRLQRADTRGGGGNFHMKPNGIFWVGEGVAGVAETARYLENPPKARFATQSGPMLVIDGRIHPKILPNGTSAKIRNGVGVDDSGGVVFAIAEEPVTFDAFARLFRDGLGCRNALFLDGSLSSLYAPELKRDDELGPIGPIVGAVRPEAVGRQ